MTQFKNGCLSAVKIIRRRIWSGTQVAERY